MNRKNSANVSHRRVLLFSVILGGITLLGSGCLQAQAKPILGPKDAVAGVKTTVKGKATVYSQDGDYGGFGGSDETASSAIDRDLSTKYLNHVQDGSNTPGVNSGLVVTPKAGATIVTGVIFTTGNDAPDRDPMTVTIEGSNDANALSEGAKGFTVIYEGKTGLDPDPDRGNPGTTVTFPNTVAYKTYRILITSTRSKGADGVQYTEVQLLGTIVAPLIPPVSGGGGPAPATK